MDRTKVSGTFDTGSIPVGGTKKTWKAKIQKSKLILIMSFKQ